MIDWFNSLTSIERVYALIAIPSTVVLIIQTLMLLFGAIGDFDSDGDGLADSTGGDDGLALFSIRSVMAFLCVGSWSGILLCQTSLPTAAAVVLSIVIGAAALLLMALLIKLILSLQSTGNIQLSNAVGKVGQVYIPIPPNSNGSGKINITIQDKYEEVSAVTTETTAIKTGELVRVVSTDEIGMVVVERLKKTSDGGE